MLISVVEVISPLALSNWFCVLLSLKVHSVCLLHECFVLIQSGYYGNHGCESALFFMDHFNLNRLLVVCLAWHWGQLQPSDCKHACLTCLILINKKPGWVSPQWGVLECSVALLFLGSSVMEILLDPRDVENHMPPWYENASKKSYALYMLFICQIFYRGPMLSSWNTMGLWFKFNVCLIKLIKIVKIIVV